MNKLLLCVALLAMSYLASADVPTYAANLLNAGVTKDDGSYLIAKCETTDGKFYYLDTNGTTSILQVWDSKTQANGDVTDLTQMNYQVNNFTLNLTNGSTYAKALRCIGTDAFLAVAFNNVTNTSGIQLFQATSTAVPVPAYYLSTVGGDLSVLQEDILAQSTSTSDGKFYYINGTFPDILLSVWDSNTKLVGDSQNISNVTAQVLSWMVNSSVILEASVILQAFGTDLYILASYQNGTNTGAELFFIQSTYPVPQYDLPLTAVPSSINQLLSQICVTNDGKLYYGDVDLNNSTVLQSWDSTNQQLGTGTSLADVYNQVNAFLATFGKSVDETNLLTCLGGSVYGNVAYSNGNTTGIEMFLLNKSAGLLTFSYAALFLALVALLL